MKTNRMLQRVVGTALVAASLALSSGCLYWAGPVPGVIYVGFAPPMPRSEVIIASPGPHYVWRPGHWRWEVHEYVWLPGGWIIIEPGYREWVPGRWAHDRHGWYWIEGRWR